MAGLAVHLDSHPHLAPDPHPHPHPHLPLLPAISCVFSYKDSGEQLTTCPTPGSLSSAFLEPKQTLCVRHPSPGLLETYPPLSQRWCMQQMRRVMGILSTVECTSLGKDFSANVDILPCKLHAWEIYQVVCGGICTAAASPHIPDHLGT